MIVFVVLLLIPILVQHVVIGKNNIDYKKKNKWALFLFFFIFTFLIMFRHESVGTDTKNYIRFFNKIIVMEWSKIGKEYVEFGFSYFAKIVSTFTNEPQIFLAVSAVLTVSLIYPTYKRLCSDSSLTIVLFCLMSTFVLSFSGMRQMLAIGVGFIAYEFTRRKKLIFYLIFVILAITIHTSAFMLIFMYPVYHAKITKKWLLMVVPTLALFFVFNRQIFSIIALFIEKYTMYDTSITQTGAYTMIILFAIFIFFSFIVPNEALFDDEAVGLRNFLLLSFVIQIFAPLHTIAMRMGYYYIVFIPLLLPKVIEYRSSKYEQVAVVGRHIMVVFFFLYFFINAYSGGGNLKVFPYHFFWESIL